MRDSKKIPPPVGTRYGKLVFIGKIEVRNHKSYWLFLCDCGNTKYMPQYNVVTSRDNIQSCGCYKKIVNNTHSMSGTKIYGVFIEVKQRCNNPRSKAYSYYGGRGIRCEWSTFESFHADMGETYKEGLTLDRINTNGNYGKENCRWATRAEQMLNTRRNRIIEYKGQKKTIFEWASEIGMHYRTLNNRINRGWNVEDALTRKVQPRHARG